jgi:hypothetical protein
MKNGFVAVPAFGDGRSSPLLFGETLYNSGKGLCFGFNICANLFHKQMLLLFCFLTGGDQSSGFSSLPQSIERYGGGASYVE